MVSKALREERQQPRRWFYLSFVDNYGFLGAAVVRAQGELTAIQRTKDLGIYPLGPDAYIPCCPTPRFASGSKERGQTNDGTAGTPPPVEPLT